MNVLLSIVAIASLVALGFYLGTSFEREKLISKIPVLEIRVFPTKDEAEEEDDDDKEDEEGILEQLH